MEEAPPQPEQHGRRFLVTVKRPWKLWVFVLGVAVLYLAWVVVVATRTVRTPGVADSDWVLVGLGLFAVLIVFELILLIPRRRRKVAEEKADSEEEWAPDSTIYAPPSGGPLDNSWGEVRTTEDELNGKSVLEFSHPPKSANKGAVYAKAFVDVGGGYVLRAEEMVAGPQEALQYA